MKPFRLLACLLLVALACSSLSCIQKGVRPAKKRPDGRIEVEFWHAMGSRQGSTLNSLIDEFNSSQEKYYVVGVYQGNYNALSQKLIASMYAGRNPAASQLYESWAARAFRYGYLQPIEHFLAKEPAYREKFEADIFPVYLDNQMLRDPGTGREVIATLPFNKSVYMWMVNLDHMKSVGVTEPPKTWAEWKDVINRMTVRKPNGEVETYGIGTRDVIESLTVNLFMANVNYIDEDENVLFDSKEGIEAMQLLYDLAMGTGKEKIGYVESGYLNTAFGAKKCASYVGSTASYSFNDGAVGSKFIWRAYPLPGRDEKTPGRVLGQGTNVGIFANKSTEEQQGAWEFLKFISEGDPLAKWCIETGYMPTRRSVLENEKLKGYLAANENMANAVACLDRVMAEPKPMYWDSCRAVVDRAVQAALTGNKTPQKAVDDAALQIRDIIKSNRLSEGAGEAGARRTAMR